MIHRRRQSHQSMASFFFGDWRFILQMAILLLALALAETVRQVAHLSSGTNGIHSPSWYFICGVNLAAAAVLFCPALLFIWTGQWLRPASGLLFKRGCAVVLFLIYFALVGFPLAGTAIESFYWTSDPRFRSGDVSSAASVALVLVCALVVCYRFVTQARGFVASLGRVLCLTVAFAMFVYVQLGRNPVARSAVPQDFRIRLVLILEGLEFTQANAYLTQQSDNALLNNVRVFRPIVIPTASYAGQLATLLSGREPFRHGIRSETLPDFNHDFFDRDLKDQIHGLERATQLHLTGIMNPSVFASIMGARAGDGNRFKGFAGTGVLCPEVSSRASDYAELQIIRDHLEPFLPRSVMQRLLPETRCVPFGTPVDDLIHEESYDGLMRAIRLALRASDEESNNSAGAGTAKSVTSIWNLSLDSMKPPTSENPDARQENFSFLLASILKNIEILGLSQQTEIHIVGLVKSIDVFGAYIALTPGAVRGTPWPLPDENILTQLRSLSAIFGARGSGSEFVKADFAQDQAEFVRRQVPQESVFYRERSGLESGAPVATSRGFAAKLHREGLCVSRTAEAQDTVDGPVVAVDKSVRSSFLVVGAVKGVAAPLKLSSPTSSDFTMPQVLADPDRCRKEISLAIAQSVIHDIDLFEPYGGAAIDFDLALKNQKEPSP